MTLRPRRVGRAATVVAALASALLLSGCGGVQPGTAVQVGDSTITADEVDDATADMCAAFTRDFVGNQQVVPQNYLRAGVVQILTMEEVARDIAAEYGVEAVPSYDRQVVTLRETAQSFPEESRETYVEILSAETYVNGVAELAGEEALLREGEQDPTSEESLARGQELFVEWQEDHDVKFDPRYGLTMRDGGIVADDTRLSYAVGESATLSRAEQPDPAYARTLPLAQRCG